MRWLDILLFVRFGWCSCRMRRAFFLSPCHSFLLCVSGLSFLFCLHACTLALKWMENDTADERAFHPASGTTHGE